MQSISCDSTFIMRKQPLVSEVFHNVMLFCSAAYGCCVCYCNGKKSNSSLGPSTFSSITDFRVRNLTFDKNPMQSSALFPSPSWPANDFLSKVRLPRPVLVGQYYFHLLPCILYNTIILCSVQSFLNAQSTAPVIIYYFDSMLSCLISIPSVSDLRYCFQP